MIKLRLLGTTELWNSEGKLAHSFLSGKKRLTLLIYLVLNYKKGYQRRDHLIGLFWPEFNQQEAKNSLSNMLWQIRKALGENLLLCRGKDELMVNISLLQCDVIQFKEVMKSNSYEKAIQLYGGKFLEGFFISNCSDLLENWIEKERELLQEQYLQALDGRAKDLSEEGGLTEAVQLLKRKVNLEPHNTQAVFDLVQALTACEEEGEGVKYAQEHAAYMEREFSENKDKLLHLLLGDKKVPTKVVKRKSRRINKFGIAVLPFEEIGDEPDIASFATGLHLDILNQLSKHAYLKVISRTSVIKYTIMQKTVPQIAFELGVSTIVEGGVQVVEDNLRVYIQVIDAQRDNQSIAETYDRKLKPDNFLKVQTELAEKISSTVVAYLRPSKLTNNLSKYGTENIEAYRYFLLGKKELDKRTKIGIEKAIACFSEALELDQRFALAWLGYANSLTLQYDYGFSISDDNTFQAQVAILKALEIDPGLSDSHASLGLLHGNNRKLSLCIQSLKRAISLNASCFEAYNWLSWSNQIIGRPKEALTYALNAVELNPLFPEAVSNLSFSLLQNGNIESALQEAKRTHELEPNWSTPQFYEALAYYELKSYQKSADLLYQLEVPWAGQGPLATWGLSCLALGYTEKTEHLANKFFNDGQYFASGLMLLGLGEYEKGISRIVQEKEWDYWSSIAFFSLYPELLGQVRKSAEAGKLIKKVYKAWGFIEK